MKKQFLCLKLLFLICLSSQAQQDFTVKGKISGLTEPSIMVLRYKNGGKSVFDSTLIENGQFVFKGKVDRTIKTVIKMIPANQKADEKRRVDQQVFFLEGGNYTVDGNGSVKKAVIKGGKAQSEYEDYKFLLSVYQAEVDALNDKKDQFKNEKNEAAEKKIQARLQSIVEDYTREENDFIYKHPDSYVSLDLLVVRTAIRELDPKIMGPLFNNLSENVRNSEEGKAFAVRLEKAGRTEIGRQAIMFTQNNTEGKPVSLASLKGKFVLIDFWASWCGPCRRENPNVVKAYNKFKEKNFEILAVSLDDKKERWLKAIKDDGLTWIHVSDLQGWKNTVAVDYGIKGVPQNYLLDPNGVIIASNLRGEELEKKLEEVLRK